MQVTDSGVIRLMTAPLKLMGFDSEEFKPPKPYVRIIASPPDAEEPFDLNKIRYRSEVCLVSSDWLTTGSTFVELNVEEEISPNDGTLPNRHYTELCEKYLDCTIPMLLSMSSQSFGVLKGLLQGKGTDFNEGLPEVEVTLPAPE